MKDVFSRVICKVMYFEIPGSHGDYGSRPVMHLLCELNGNSVVADNITLTDDGANRFLNAMIELHEMDPIRLSAWDRITSIISRIW